MRDYQVTKNNPWYIENKNIRREARYIVQDYHNLLSQKTKLSRRRSALTEHEKAILQMTEMKLTAIEQTIVELRGKYADTFTGEEFDAHGAFENYETFCYYRSRKDKDTAPSKGAYARYRAEFKWNVAMRMNFI